MKRSRLLVLGVVLALAGCGRAADLKAVAGHAMPVRPLMARTEPTANDLLTPPAYARPNRVDELVKRSAPRPADPFDLSPPTGGTAPAMPAGSEPEQPVSNEAGAATPGR